MAEPLAGSQMRSSKILLYERPCSVTGTGKLTGVKEASKDICKAKIIGTWKARNVEDVQIQRNVYKDKD